MTIVTILGSVQVYEMYGYHLAVTSYFICHDPAKIKAMFDRIRTLGPDGKYPATVGGFEIKSIRDLTTGTYYLQIDIDKSCI
jgi:hypothetical protein